MLIYEVNLTVQESIAGAYLEWLRRHIPEILSFDGFEYATLLFGEAEPGMRLYSVHYYVADRASLDDYFANHAATMRQDAIERFGDQFTASRRVFEVAGEFTAS
jgi:Domain of unknown function (DUF4286)